MTAGRADMMQPPSTFGAATAAPILWGLNATALHDRFWAARGVQVVRRRGGDTPLAAPGLFLLLEPRQLVLFDVPPAAARLSHRRPEVLRVGLTAEAGRDYREEVRADRRCRLTAVRRRYRATAPPRFHAALTGDAELASLWRRYGDPRTAQNAFRRAADAARSGPSPTRGTSFDARDAGQARQCILALMARWRDPGAFCSNVRRHAPGVWAHASAVIKPDARLVAPLWIGAGVTVQNGEVRVGPSLIEDETPTDAAAAPVPQPLRPGRKPLAGPPAIRRQGRVGRRLFNIAFSVTALLLTAPLFPLIMLAIWLEDGRPFLFPHTRQTVGGRDFVCYKFRTMCKQAEQLKASLQHENICDGPQFHIANDPRLLRVGRLLRKFHLDELPQFFNVLRGQMDVVGPRPSPDAENQFCPAWREARLSVRPGMTGLWQISRTRAPNTDFQEWIRYDLDYVQRRNWRLDLWIIYRTLKSIVMRGNRCRGTTYNPAQRTRDDQRRDPACGSDGPTMTEIPASDATNPVIGTVDPATGAADEDTYRAAA